MISRPAFGGLAPAKQTLQTEAHQALIVQFGAEEEQPVPPIRRVAASLWCTAAKRNCSIHKDAHCLFTVLETVDSSRCQVQRTSCGRRPCVVMASAAPVTRPFT